jgi:imidazolonepropionase-like amidohydrolase
VRVAIGTDSLASVEDLNLFSEMAAVRRLAPRLPASRVIQSATIDGANALGFGEDYGSIAPGRRADLIAVRVPPALEDVEEYLVGGGVEPDAIRWLKVVSKPS